MLLLIAVPDAAERSRLLKHCQRSGYKVCEQGLIEEAPAAVQALCPDLVLLGWPTEPEGGRTVLEGLREHRYGTAVVVIGTAQDAETAVACLEAGADDYLRRPYDLRELLARLAVLARRHHSEQPVVKAGPIAIDDRCKRVTVYGTEIHLSPKEYQLLQLCAGDPGRVFSHEEIIDRLWPERDPAEPIDIKQYVHLLRTKLAKVPRGRNLIENVKGFGYRLAT